MCLSQEKKPILYLKGVRSHDIENLLRLVYLAENTFDLSKFRHLGIIKFDGTESVNSSEKGSDFGTPEPPVTPISSGSNTGSAPSLANGETEEEEAERIAKAEFAAEIPNTADGTHLCKYCYAKLGNKRSYITFLQRHAGMLDFKCKYCNKTFHARVTLNIHMNTHFRDEIGANIGQRMLKSMKIVKKKKLKI